MPYAPQTWVDNVTPVDAPHMKHIEDGIVALDAVSAPPVVNGQWLKGVGGAVVWSAITAADLPPQAVATYGTTLPASPSDGAEHVLVDSTTNPSWQWRFRYNAGSTYTYKWEFIGGSAAYVFVSSAEACAAINVWTNLATVGPDFVVPRTGDYRAQFTCYTGSPGSVSLMQMGIANASVALTPVGQYALSILPAGGYLQLAGQSLLPGIVGGQTLRATYQTSVTNMSFGFRTLSILPARVA